MVGRALSRSNTTVVRVSAAKVDRLDNQDRLVYRLVVATADVWDPYAGALPPPPPPPHGDSLVLINDDDVTVV